MSNSVAAVGRMWMLPFATLSLALSWACASQEVASPAAQTGQPVAAVQPAVPSGPTRMEKDLLGEKAVPSGAYYGVQTARALENFKISGIPISHYPGFIEGFVIVKLAAATA